MKKKTVFMVVLITMTVLALPALSLDLGIKGAIGDYSLTGDDWKALEDSTGVSNEFSLSYSIGLLAEISFSNLFALQPELLYTPASIRWGDGTDWARESWKLMEIPLYLKIRPTGRAGGLFVMAGPELLYILDDIDIEDNSGATMTRVKDNDVLYGIAAAAGVELQSRACVDIRYSRVFNETTEDVKMYPWALVVEFSFMLF
jgi:hypothetical protein